MPKFFNTNAVVINKRHQKEGDLIITLFTYDLGKIQCLAKNVQSLKSRRLGHLEVGSIIKVSLYEKNSFYWISESESLFSFLHQSSSLAQINLLFYFLEVVNNLLPKEQKQSDIFTIIVDGVKAISQNNFSAFIGQEILLLDKLGYGVTPEALDAYHRTDFKNTQKLLKAQFESLIEKPLKSSHLFH